MQRDTERSVDGRLLLIVVRTRRIINRLHRGAETFLLAIRPSAESADATTTATMSGHSSVGDK